MFAGVSVCMRLCRCVCSCVYETVGVCTCVYETVGMCVSVGSCKCGCVYMCIIASISLMFQDAER